MRTIITSALPYANGYIHLGHLAGAYLPADMYARYMRLSGEEVLYICGSDEHGVAINISAEKENTTPKYIIDKYHRANLEAFAKFGMSFDFYSRTSSKIHHEDAIKVFERLLAAGYLYEKESPQFYDEKANMFLPDRYIEGTCPNCGATEARGDQCDACGAYYDQVELIDPISIVTKTKPVIKNTTHWYFKLSMFQEFLELYIESNAKLWKDNVIQQAKSWLKQGLKDRAITRDLNWGVSIENAKGVDKEKAKGKVLYVWFDAVLGYISATKEWAIKQESHSNGIKADDWSKWWKDEEIKHIAFIGKDNIVFHAIMLPAIEMAYGGLIMPTNIPANEFLNLEGQKFSKSKNWSIDLKDFIDDFATTQAVDALRYTLATTLPENKDADFTWKDYQAKTNNELAAILGNFINRTLAFVYNKIGGRVPLLPKGFESVHKDLKIIDEIYIANMDKSLVEIKELCKQKISDALEDNDLTLLLNIAYHITKANEAYRNFRMKDAVMETMNVARAANKYFNDEEPWKTLKENPEKCHKTLYICCQCVNLLGVWFAPVIPYTAAKIQTYFNTANLLGVPNNGIKTKNYLRNALFFNIPEGIEINEPTILFNRVEDDVIERQIAKLGNSNIIDSKGTKINEKENDKTISIDEFANVKLCVGKVLEAEIVPKSKKLIKMQVQIGNEKRQILAGVAEFYQPEYIVGKSIIVVTNLRTTKIMGIESQGMMLCAADDKNVFFLTPEQNIADGSIVR